MVFWAGVHVLPIKGDAMAQSKKRTRKSQTSRKKTTHELIDTKTENLLPSTVEEFSSPAAKPPIRFHHVALFILLVGLTAVFLTNKGLFVAAVVNGRPIFRWQMNKVLVSRFGKQTVESMISEMLIADAAREAGVSISQGEIDGKVSELVSAMGGDVNIDELLTYQGMTKEDFESQIRLQLMVEKVLTKDLAIAETDIDNYIATNRALLVATDEAALRAEARQAIVSKTVSEKLQPWFLELKEKAKILRFL